MVLFWALCALAADVTFTHQGRILDGTGEPLEGELPLSVALYVGEGAGSPLTTQGVTGAVNDGYYSVSLGPVDTADLTTDLWIQVLLDGVALGSRTPLGEVPVAAMAHESTTAAQVDGVSVDLSGCSDGDVLTYRSGGLVCEPAPDNGVIINVTTHVSSTRRVLPATSNIEMERFTVDKKSPTSILLIHGTISGWGNYSGSMQQGWTYGSASEVRAQSVMYDNTEHSKVYPTTAVITGVTQTGPQDLVFRYFNQHGNGGSDRPFVTYNPSSSDDTRHGQTQSVYTVWEIEP